MCLHILGRTSEGKDQCLECKRLWKDTIFTLVRISREMKTAPLRLESPELMALTKEGVAAAARRRHVALGLLRRTHTLRNCDVRIRRSVA